MIEEEIERVAGAEQESTLPISDGADQQAGTGRIKRICLISLANIQMARRIQATREDH